MSIMGPWRFLSTGFCLLVLLPCGCKRSSAPAPSASGSGPSASASAAAPPSSEPASQCRRLAAFALTLDASAGPEPKPSEALPEDEGDDALLPFGVDLGEAIATPAGFVVAGVRGAGQAFVAVLNAGDSRRVDLEELHGEPETPALASAGERTLVALRSSDAAGYTIKLGEIGAAGNVSWGQELTKLGKSVTSLELAVSGARGLLVFQSDEKGSSRILRAAFSGSDLKQPLELAPLDAKNVELPRLSARPGGYWLTWLRSLPEPKKTVKPVADAGAAEDPEERELLDAGLRVVEVSKLDETGKPLGAALKLGEPRRQIILFDVAPLPTGGLLVATRSDQAAPGAEGGALVLSEVGADGSVKEERLDDDDIGAGAPLLLLDALAKAPEPWLSVSSPTDAPRVGPVHGARTQLLTDPALSKSEVLALRAGHFLTARARGRSVELSAFDCRLAPPSAAGASATPPASAPLP
jgi:hypothetical protein